ncbi:hypothetical protein ABW19_dt0204062 [Dactylella cylindrospora]|nr:hypothetical protein ABW19_dt0204062 [Dactylella cylindrospora]
MTKAILFRHSLELYHCTALTSNRMDTLCRRCFTRIAFRSRRTFASIATSQPSPSVPDELVNVPSEDGTAVEPEDPYKDYVRPPSIYQLAASTIISRPPILTRDLSDFEKEFFFYQRRLDKRLVKPFVRNFYFKPGTLSYDEWRTKRKDMTHYNPYSRTTGWMDEMRLGQKPYDDEDMDYDSLVKYTVSGEDISASDTEEEIAAKKVMDKPSPRETQADIANDTRSLNRKLSRTLYLLVKREARDRNIWKFPQTNLIDKENLKEVCEV